MGRSPGELPVLGASQELRGTRGAETRRQPQPRAGKQPAFQESPWGGGREECGGANKLRAGSPLQGPPWGLGPGMCALAVRAGSVEPGPGDPLPTLETIYDSAPPAGPQGPYRGPASPALPSPPHPHSGCSRSSALQLLPHLPLPGAPAFVPPQAPVTREKCPGSGIIYCCSLLLLPVTCPLTPSGF